MLHPKLIETAIHLLPKEAVTLVVAASVGVTSVLSATACLIKAASPFLELYKTLKSLRPGKECAPQLYDAYNRPVAKNRKR